MKSTFLDIKALSLKTKSHWELWCQFFPLAMSDITMALADPLRTIALSRFSNPEITFAIFGAVKSIAMLFESPVLAILHASTALSIDHRSHMALRRFVLILSSILTILLLILCLEPIYLWVFKTCFLFSNQALDVGKTALIWIVPLPLAIAYRRFFQGVLIRNRQEKEMSFASIMRLLFVGFILVIGYYCNLDAIFIAIISLIAPTILEAFMVVLSVKKTTPNDMPKAHLPVTFNQVTKYYLPLGTTSMVVWAGKAALISVIAHAQSGMMAVAAWTIACGFFLPVANSTRMLQQIVISAPISTPQSLCFSFSLIIGLLGSLPLLFLGYASMGQRLLHILLFDNTLLVKEVLLSIKALFFLPILVALQNYFQGCLVLLNRLWLINLATIINVVVMLSISTLLIFLNISGSLAAALASIFSLIGEIIVLHMALDRQKHK